MSLSRLFAPFVIVSVAACERAAPPPDANAAADHVHDTPVAVAGCYRSSGSVMGRTTPLVGHASVDPGWLRFDSTSSPDSGAVQLVDADGAEFRAIWHRTAADSIAIQGFDDFMQVAIRASVADSALAGRGLVTSDADVQRNAAGQLEPLRREWSLRARAASCDGVPPVTK